MAERIFGNASALDRGYQILAYAVIMTANDSVHAQDAGSGSGSKAGLSSMPARIGARSPVGKKRNACVEGHRKDGL